MSDALGGSAGGSCNIGPRGVRQRGTAGFVALFAGLGLAVWCVLAERGWLWRNVAVALVSFGALALLQARART